MDHNNYSLKTYMAIMAERDAAIRERNMALEERKRAFAERDMAMLQRDAAIAERNSAIEDRNNAIAALQIRETSENDDMIPDSHGDAIASGTNYQTHQHQVYPRVSEAANDLDEQLKNDEVRIVDADTENASSSKVRQVKESNRAKSAGGIENSNSHLLNPTFDSWNDLHDLNSTEEDPEGHSVDWKDDLVLNQISFDESAMPAPVCSCTGVPQPCYKWGNGGWQSACCTTTMSVYPLPQTSSKRSARVGGRKMSGSAFSKLLNRLVDEGYDLSRPLDLKDHWAKHGTNRYTALK